MNKLMMTCDFYLQDLRLAGFATGAACSDRAGCQHIILSILLDLFIHHHVAMTLQEDFIILEHDETENCWRFVTGVAGFSFVELGINGEKGFMTPGASMASIHTPVPGFNPTIHDQVTVFVFDKGSHWCSPR